MRGDRTVPVFAVVFLLVAGCSGEGGDDPDPERSGPPTVEIVALDGRPADVAIGSGTVWVVDDDLDQIARLDHAGDVAGPAVAVEPGPVAVALDSDGSTLWVAHRDGQLTPIETSTGLAGDPIDVGVASVDVTVAPDGTVWVADIESSTVRPIDPGSHEPGQPIEVPAGAVRLVSADRLLWVSGLGDSVTPVDTSTGRAGAAVRVGAGPIGMVVAEGKLLVANSDDDTVSRLDAVAGERIGSDVVVGDAPIGISVVGDEVWVLDQDAQTLSRLDGQSLVPLGAVDLDLRPRALAVGAPGPVVVVGVDPSAAVYITPTT